MGEENKTLVIWFNDGTTAYFEHVENFERLGDSETILEPDVIVFDYFGKSTVSKRSARFYLDNLAGYALSK